MPQYISPGNMKNTQHYDYLSLKHEKKEIYIAADNDFSLEVGN